MRPLAIVMTGEHGDDPLKMLVVQDQQPVETLGANGPHKSLRHAIRLRRAKRRANDLKPTASKHLSKLAVNFWSRARIRKRNDSGCSARGHVSCPARCITHPQPGLALQPPTCPRLRPRS